MYDLAQVERMAGTVDKTLSILSDPGDYIANYTDLGADIFEFGADLNIPIISDISGAISSGFGKGSEFLRGTGSSTIDARVDEIFYPEYGMGDSFRNSGGSSFANSQRSGFRKR